MNKKLIGILLACAMLFSIGCSTVPEGPEQAGTPVPTETPAPTAVPTSEASETPAPTAEALPTQTPEVIEIGPVFDVESIAFTGDTLNIPEFAADYDLTLVNFWATWCSACIMEMPVLQKLHTRFQEGTDNASVAILGVLTDPENGDLVEMILSYFGLSYPMTNPSMDMLDYVNFSVMPVTLFLDSEGNIVGDPVFGAKDEATWLAIIESRLAGLGLSL